MIWFTAAMAVFAALFLAAAYEPRTRAPRPAFQQPLCPCPKQCGRPTGQHVKPYAQLLAPSPVIRIPGQRRRQP